jgi:type III pantothenate kinase
MLITKCSVPEIENIWIALAIGNSRYHWAWFLNTQLQSSWDTAYPTADTIARIRSIDLVDNHWRELLPIDLIQELDYRKISLAKIPIKFISVVPNQTEIWQQLPQVKQITLIDIPLRNLYPTLGIDRALALYGAGEIYSYPVLVIDGGTALTLSGIDACRGLIGGAIMPGLKLQLRSLSIATALLPEIILPTALPPRWSNDTVDAIASGVIYGVVAGIIDFIQDWQRLYADSNIVITGGDGELLTKYLYSIAPPNITQFLKFDRQLLFQGFLAILD